MYLDSEKAEETAARAMAARISQGDRRRTSLVLMKALVKDMEEASHPLHDVADSHPQRGHGENRPR